MPDIIAFMIHLMRELFAALEIHNLNFLWIVLITFVGPLIHAAIVRLLRLTRLNFWHKQDVLAYLGGSFDNPEVLLKQMARANLILSGSRALAFFVPGSCTDTSDWDFYTYSSRYCVGLSLDALSVAGVQWDDVFEPLRAAARNIDGGLTKVTTMHECHIHELLRRAHQWALDGRALDLAAAEALRSVSTGPNVNDGGRFRLVTFPSGSTLRIMSSNLDTSGADTIYGTAVHVITGRTTSNGTSHKVQLVFHPTKSPLEMVMDFYASSVQCCITAFGAAHLYLGLALDRCGIAFPNNSQHVPSARSAIAKYESRTWRFWVPHGILSSNISDHSLHTSPNAKYVPFTYETGLPQHLDKARRAALANLRWQTSEGETRLIRSEPLSLRSALFASYKARNPNHPVLLAAASLAGEHSIVFSEPTSNRPSEQTTSFPAMKFRDITADELSGI